MSYEIIEVGQSKEVPEKMVIYGVPKIGKSRFGAQIPGAFFIDAEGGLSYLERKVRATPTLKTFDEVIGWLKYILEPGTITDDVKTIVIDSLDWVEKLAQEKICKKYNATSIVDPSIKDFAYYKGITMAAEETWRIFTILKQLFDTKRIKTLIIAHSAIKEMDLPGKDNYSKHTLKLSKALLGKVNEWADLILFADYSFFVDKDGKTSEPKPILLTGGDPSFEGGGRMLLKKQIPLDYNKLVDEIIKK